MILLAILLALVLAVAVIGTAVEQEAPLAALGIAAAILLTVVVVLRWAHDVGVLS